MIEDFCKWLGSLEGTMVRGRLVVDTDAYIQADLSARITVTVEGRQKSLAEHVFDDGESDEINWHMADVTKYRESEPVWEYWDEFAERDRLEQKGQSTE